MSREPRTRSNPCSPAFGDWASWRVASSVTISACSPGTLRSHLPMLLEPRRQFAFELARPTVDPHGQRSRRCLPCPRPTIPDPVLRHGQSRPVSRIYERVSPHLRSRNFVRRVRRRISQYPSDSRIHRGTKPGRRLLPAGGGRPAKHGNSHLRAHQGPPPPRASRRYFQRATVLGCLQDSRPRR
jgi:hypothetical protein